MGDNVVKRNYELYRKLYKKFPKLFKKEYVQSIKSTRSRTQRRKPDPQELVAYKDIVATLNNTFNRNRYYKTKMKPFRAVWLEHKWKWILTCSDHYTYSDDKRLQPMLKALKRKHNNINIDLRFSTDTEVREYKLFEMS